MKCSGLVLMFYCTDNWMLINLIMYNMMWCLLRLVKSSSLSHLMCNTCAMKCMLC